MNAPTCTGYWPLRPTRRVDDELHAKYPTIFQVGDPVAYTRNPDEWLPEYSLEVMPVPKPPTDKEFKVSMPQKQKTPKPVKSVPQKPPALEPETVQKMEIVMALMNEIALTGNKKAVAAIVKAAIAAREIAKVFREIESKEAAPLVEGQ